MVTLTVNVNDKKSEKALKLLFEALNLSYEMTTQSKIGGVTTKKFPQKASKNIKTNKRLI